MAVFPGWSFWSLVTGTGELFIFIALLINVEYSQGFFFFFPFFLSSLLFGKVTDSWCGQRGILNVSHHQMLLFGALFSLVLNLPFDYARVRALAAC